MRRLPQIIYKAGIRKLSGSSTSASGLIVGFGITTIVSITGNLLYFDNKFETKFNRIDDKFNIIDNDIKSLKSSMDALVYEIKKK